MENNESRITSLEYTTMDQGEKINKIHNSHNTSKVISIVALVLSILSFILSTGTVNTVNDFIQSFTTESNPTNNIEPVNTKPISEITTMESVISNITPVETKTPETKALETKAPESGYVKELELYNDSRFKYSFSIDKTTGILGGYEIKSNMENNFKHTCTFRWDNVSVNGYSMSSTWVYEEVASNKKGIDKGTIYESTLQKTYNIYSINEIEFDLIISDDENWDTVVKQHFVISVKDTDNSVLLSIKN